MPSPFGLRPQHVRFVETPQERRATELKAQSRRALGPLPLTRQKPLHHPRRYVEPRGQFFLQRRVVGVEHQGADVHGAERRADEDVGDDAGLVDGAGKAGEVRMSRTRSRAFPAKTESPSMLYLFVFT